MQIEELNFDLPPEQIAKHPAEPRDSCRLMVVYRREGRIEHTVFSELPRFLDPGDLLILNESKVFPARIYGKCGLRNTEVFFLSSEPEVSGRYRCLVRPGRKIQSAPTEILFEDGTRANLVREEEHGFSIQLPWSDKAKTLGWLDRYGSIPLPPYLHREAQPEDNQDYQTVYASSAGSVAAPTAGLHFTPQLLDRLQIEGIKTARLSLHVGYGTFAPLSDESVASGTLHSEQYLIPEETQSALANTRHQKKRIIAVGTTSTRALESQPYQGPRGDTTLFIRPGHPFQWTDAMITNFHLPGSSLLWLIGAFLGIDQTKACYREAIERGYRFYSYGDAMLIL